MIKFKYMNCDKQGLDNQITRLKCLLQRMPLEMALQVVSSVINSISSTRPSPNVLQAPILSSSSISGVKNEQIEEGGVNKWTYTPPLYIGTLGTQIVPNSQFTRGTGNLPLKYPKELQSFENAMTFVISNLINKSKETIKAYTSDLKDFGTFLKKHKNLDFRFLRIKDIKEYINSLIGKLKNSSINRKLAAISTFYEILRYEFEDIITFNPVTKRCYLKIPERLSNPPSDDNVAKLLAGITNQRDKALFVVYVASGARLSELTDIKESKIKIKSMLINGKIVLYGSIRVIGKGDKMREIYIYHDAVIGYMKYWEMKPEKGNDVYAFQNSYDFKMTGGWVEKRLDYWCKKLDLPHINPHKLRHYFSNSMRNNGMDIHIISELLGHKSIKTTEGYLKKLGPNPIVLKEYFNVSQKQKKVETQE